jgi:hypothetical protein
MKGYLAANSLRRVNIGNVKTNGKQRDCTKQLLREISFD